ncbi:MAG: hypothetical protein AB7I24_06980 [Candidatus Nanopelagicales bacterium]
MSTTSIPALSADRQRLVDEGLLSVGPGGEMVVTDRGHVELDADRLDGHPAWCTGHSIEQDSVWHTRDLAEDRGHGSARLIAGLDEGGPTLDLWGEHGEVQIAGLTCVNADAMPVDAAEQLRGLASVLLEAARALDECSGLLP